MAENPYYWPEVVHIITRELEEHEERLREGLPGHSLQWNIYQALKENNLLSDDSRNLVAAKKSL